MKQISFNYKMFRWAALIFWLIFIGSLLLLSGWDAAVFYSGKIAVYIFMFISGIGFLWEIREYFRKKKQKS